MHRPAFPLIVFYDGACIVCATEIAHYGRMAHQGRLRLVDISDPHFDPAPYGRSLEQFMEQMHVLDSKGRYYLGVDAFPAIWAALPGRSWRLLARVIAWPGVHHLARCGYRAFARLRRYLPRRESQCNGGTCRLHHHR